jgi:serine/threonine-protein kinase HipA
LLHRKCPEFSRGLGGEVVSRYFDNLLPDNEEIKKLVATKFGAESIRPFDLLSAIGKDCVGALSFLPNDSEPPTDFEMNYSPISDKKIEKRLGTLGSTTPLGMDGEDFRISIAGAQEKTALLNIDGKWYEPHGLTPTTHIFKTSIGALGVDVNFDDSIDNEWASLFIMKKMGLPVCNAKISKFGSQKALVIERFDRKWRSFKGREILLRVPQEDMCQALSISPYKKYQSEGGPGIIDISKFLMASKNSEDRINFFKAIIVFDLLHATDGHGKNFSIFIEEDGFRLTPFYDVMSGYFLHKREKKPLEKLKLAMKVGNSGHYAFKRIEKRHYAETAHKCSINEEKFELIISELKKKYESLKIQDKELDPMLNKATLEMILEGMARRAKLIFS